MTLRYLLTTTALLLFVVSPISFSQAKETGANAGSAPRVLISTNMGDITLELDAAKAPLTVANFLQYVDDGFYSDTIFHRVIEGFMIQGGGFSSQYQRKTTRPPINNEAFNGLRNVKYSIAMARTNAPHSATSQFFINAEDNTNLDHTSATARGWGYTVFGRVIDGHEVIDAINQVKTGSGGPFSRDVPAEQVIIESASQVQSGATVPAVNRTTAGELGEGVRKAAPVQTDTQDDIQN